MPDATPDDGSDHRTAFELIAPGPERRRALREAGLSLVLADFSEDEQHERWGSRSPRRRPNRKQSDS